MPLIQLLACRRLASGMRTRRSRSPPSVPGIVSSHDACGTLPRSCPGGGRLVRADYRLLLIAHLYGVSATSYDRASDYGGGTGRDGSLRP